MQGALRHGLLGFTLLLAAGVSSCHKTVFLDEAWRARDAATSQDVATEARDAQDASSGPDRPVACTGLQPLRHFVGAADVIISLDRSNTMTSAFGNDTRIRAAKDSTLRMVASYDTVVRFGYEEFPIDPHNCGSGDGCCAGSVSVPPGPDAYAGIESAMARCQADPGGCGRPSSKPTVHALEQTRGFYEWYDDYSSKRYVLLVTDGEPSCGDPATQCDAAVAEVAKLHSADVNTMVVGIDESMNGCLDRMALAGGMARPQSPYYYAAADTAALDAALSVLASRAAAERCHIGLMTTPPDPSQVGLWFDGVVVPRDVFNTEGWNYDPGSIFRITVYGSWCTKLKAGEVAAVELWACDSAP